MVHISTVNITGYKKYITRNGDTYDMLAIAFYDDEMMSTYIMQANERYIGTVIFDAGIVLRIPILDIVETPETLPPWRR